MRKTAMCAAIVAFATGVAAQDGVSTAGSARAGYAGKHGFYPAASEIVVEDFINYHRHELPRPKAGAAVSLDLRWGGEKAGPSGEAVLQIGFATALQSEARRLRPVNLALVIDKSGSMAAEDKLERVKQAMLTLVEQLRETDTLSIVTFDSEAQVAYSAHRLDNKEAVRGVVRELKPGSSTNIHSGLMLGYREAMRAFDASGTNRVVLLTDGIANQGVIEPDKIAAASQEFNAKGIDLTTIGLGAELNKDLLRKLAKSGHGLFHFIGDTADIEKVFVKEIQSQLSPVADRPELVVEIPSGLRLTQVYGFEPVVGEKTVRIALDTMNSGMTEVVLMRFQAGPGRHTVKARLTYRDVDRNKRVTLSTADEVSGTRSDESVSDPQVLKNLTIAELAQAVHEMAVQVEARKFSAAKAALDTAVLDTKERYPSLTDADIRRNLEIAVTYRDMLTREIGSEPTGSGLGRNIIANGDFSQGNTGFACELDYIKPSPNCLWGTYYTVAASFSSPFQLHTNVPANSYAAPGGGSVLFMNAGGGQEMTVYRSRVKCARRTKYQVSVYEISLSGGPQWVNSYEIRVNGKRSNPMPGGDGGYVPLAFSWESGEDEWATVSLVRVQRSGTGGVIGIANVEMRPATADR